MGGASVDSLHGLQTKRTECPKCGNLLLLLAQFCHECGCRVPARESRRKRSCASTDVSLLSSAHSSRFPSSVHASYQLPAYLKNHMRENPCTGSARSSCSSTVSTIDFPLWAQDLIDDPKIKMEGLRLREKGLKESGKLVKKRSTDPYADVSENEAAAAVLEEHNRRHCTRGRPSSQCSDRRSRHSVAPSSPHGSSKHAGSSRTGSVQGTERLLRDATSLFLAATAAEAVKTGQNVTSIMEGPVRPLSRSAHARVRSQERGAVLKEYPAKYLNSRGNRFSRKQQYRDMMGGLENERSSTTNQLYFQPYDSHDMQKPVTPRKATVVLGTEGPEFETTSASFYKAPQPKDLKYSRTKQMRRLKSTSFV